MEEKEEGLNLNLDYSKLKQIASIDEDVIPVAVQNIETGDVLIVAYVNQKALDYTIKNKVATFWSTSRNEIWVKGSTSGNTLELVDVRVNCDQNSLLYRVIPENKNACHTDRPTCYYRKIKSSKMEFIHE
ncbi:MAG: phosphoribosyl-AMP cyclohydrolase [Candidatus Marinimicrobia bacterium]|jgi:phosphoribosyl-AMP cyclohydrolase|nr:phosphoribosyl-AMP cyclohydrolase [Candidatus Neomarinimicrobiota bacterium]MBT3936814.1 phosphoribosyl-AMP cyclohydrolase [Candidatus Neomarinimicrobiota bacterium]MBT3961991.1 phosphoribosyl-AMP cyclohydrolase [Candidatus Neomarinimicrobiota bacterium]MBT4383681.1 phosphoribosyl-AMP cyclohydrolase [Candidatus Neomarinimicrobiota bacterium]MBT4637156.1 phosphoribosyl-AMP cyclohydrolase [Candidatus Neomarinimicrobiota bacterium]